MSKSPACLTTGALAALSVLAFDATGPVAAAGGDLVDAFTRLTKNAAWQRVAAKPVGFDTHHPQGFAKVGDALFVSSVEVIEPTEKFAEPQGGLDRTAGAGKGHLFKMDLEGNLLEQVELGKGNIYHPGGIDFDGESLWVPVAEYRPNSNSIVYRVDPETLEATEVFRYPDHIGGVVHNTDDGTLHGVSWGSRRFYTWDLADSGAVTNADEPPDKLMVLNPAHYIDYQDCQYAGRGQAFCFGLNKYQPSADAPEFALGGAELVDLRTNRPLYQVPVPLWTEDGTSLTQNPVHLEPADDGLRAYFMPEDNESRLFVYEVAPGG